MPPQLFRDKRLVEIFEVVPERFDERNGLIAAAAALTEADAKGPPGGQEMLQGTPAVLLGPCVGGLGALRCDCLLLWKDESVAAREHVVEGDLREVS